MKPERWQRIDEIFGVALQHKPDERKAFLDEACRGDEELRQEVESLLAAEESSRQVHRRTRNGHHRKGSGR